MRNRHLLLGFIFLLFQIQITMAAEHPYRTGAIAGGQAGAGRASVDPTESGWMNPAALVYNQTALMGLSTQYSQLANGDSWHDWAVTAVDGATEDRPAGGSLSYIRRDTLRGGVGSIRGEQQDIQFSFATYISENSRGVSLGVTLRHLIHQSYAMDISQTNYSLGLVVPFADKWAFALVGQDLAGAPDQVPAEARMIPQFTFGLHFLPMKTFRVRADWSTQFEEEALGSAARSDFRLGVESRMNDYFAFRAGGAWIETKDQMWLTAGIGFKGPRLSFGYSYEKDIRAVGNIGEGSRHTFDLWLPL